MSSLMWEPSSVAELNTTGASAQSCDLLDFLAVVQATNLPIFRFNCQDARGYNPVGEGARGGTARVQQVEMSMKVTLAVKCVVDKERTKDHMDNSYRQLIREVLVLTHPPIREAKNIVNVGGICWDFASDQRDTASVWPAVVLEKVPHGVMNSRDSTVEALTDCERLELCLDVGNALMILHQAGIAHGDIKPENVLIFRKNGGNTAKLIDFGYSHFRSQNDPYTLAISRPWMAPELEQSTELGTFDHVLRTDVYSYAKLCVWTLFHQYDVHIAEHETQEIQRLVDNFLPDLHIEAAKRAQLGIFFNLALRSEPENRPHSLSTAFPLLASSRKITKSGIPIMEVNWDQLSSDFEVPRYMAPLYLASHEVRQALFNLYLDRYQTCPESKKKGIRQQLYLCHAIGFGTRRNPEKMAILRNEDDELAMWFNGVAKTIGRGDARDSWSLDQTNRFSLEIMENYSLENLSPVDRWLTPEDFERLTNEHADLQHSGGAPFPELAVLYDIVSYLVSGGKFAEAEIHQLRVREVLHEHFVKRLDWLAQCNLQLANIYMGQGKYQEAFDVYEKAMLDLERHHGPHSLLVLSHKVKLLGTLSGFGWHDQVLKPLEDCHSVLAAIFGPDHPETIFCEKNILQNLYDCKRYEEVGRRGLELSQKCMRVYGSHTHTAGQGQAMMVVEMVKMIQGSAKTELGELGHADELFKEALHIVEECLGKTHVQRCMPLLGRSRVELKRGNFQEAENLAKESIGVFESVGGTDDVLYHLAKAALGHVYSEQDPGDGRLMAAENILREALPALQAKFGLRHPLTLESMLKYSEVLEKLQKHEEARVISEQHETYRREGIGMDLRCPRVNSPGRVVVLRMNPNLTRNPSLTNQNLTRIAQDWIARRTGRN